MPVEAGLEMSPSDLSSGYLTVRGLLRLHSNFSCYQGRGKVESSQHCNARWTTTYMGCTTYMHARPPYLAVFEGPTSWGMVQEPWAGGQVFVGATWWWCGSVAVQVALALLLTRWTLVPQRWTAKSKRDDQMTPPEDSNLALLSQGSQVSELPATPSLTHCPTLLSPSLALTPGTPQVGNRHSCSQTDRLHACHQG